MSKHGKQAEFTRWMGYLLDALRALGGKASPRECSDWIAEKLNVPQEVLAAKTKSGGEKFHNQVQWARQYLAWEGLIDSPKRGTWMLTAKGAKTHFDEQQGHDLFLKWVRIYQEGKKSKAVEVGLPPPAPDPEEKVPEEVEEQALLGVLQKLPPDAFERLCKRLLHEFGFERVTVTGKSHDGGIDGLGILRLNPFVSLKVMFQCKRYRGAVSRAQVGDFRNAMLGRADKGILITTGYFSSDATKEANRDGVPPVELIDGERLVELFESKQIGLRRREIYEIDHSFFDQFTQP